jgi:hypothetical protein
MDRKACCDAEIIECINRIIEKDNDKLYDKLKKMGIAFAAMTVRQISLLEKRIATAMKKWHKSEKTSLLNSESLFSFLSSHTTESEADAELVQAVSQAVEETCGDVLQASADQYIRQTDAELSVTEISAPTAAAVSEASVQAGTSVLRHVTDEISNIIQEAMNNGDSVDDATKRIFDGRLRDEYYEARRVAQTEMMRTHAYAKYEALQQSPVVNAKRWRHTGAKGAASRENHVNISGQTVPKDQPFTLTGRDGATYHPMLPHDTALPAAEAINCHCILEAVIDKDLKSLPPEQKAQMQRDNIRMLNENYAEKSGKHKQIAGLPVDNQENGGIMRMGKTKSPVQKPPDFSKYEVKEDFEAVERVKQVLINDFGLEEKNIQLDGLKNADALEPFVKRMNKIRQETGLVLPNIKAVEVIEGDPCCISSYKPYENSLYISSKYFNSKNAIEDTLKDWSSNKIMPKQAKSIQFLAEHEAAHIRIPKQLIESENGYNIFKKAIKAGVCENDKNIYEFYADSMALSRIGYSDKIVELVTEHLHQGGIR